MLSDDSVTKRGDQFLDLMTEQWNIASELVKVLEPFDVATTFFSYKESPSLSCVLPTLDGLVEKLTCTCEDLPEVRQFKKKVCEEIKRRWNFDDLNSGIILVLCSAVDPTFKQLKFLDDEGREDVKEELITRMEKFVVEEQDKADVSDEQLQSKKLKLTALDCLLGPESTSSVLAPKDEIETFLSREPSSSKLLPSYLVERQYC